MACHISNDARATGAQQTARLNDIDPLTWLADVLARLHDHPAKRIDEPGTGSCTDNNAPQLDRSTPRQVQSARPSPDAYAMTRPVFFEFDDVRRCPEVCGAGTRSYCHRIPRRRGGRSARIAVRLNRGTLMERQASSNES
jgi:hypothetical protein